MDIPTLLNPETNTRLRPRNSLVPRPAIERTDEDEPEVTSGPESMKKKQIKVAKDAAKFEKGITTGVVRFPPFETKDEELKKMHKEVQLFPTDGIAEYPRHIPYSSDKKTFQGMTCRDGFEVFQYTFKHYENNKDWVVMWDYNIGLVRITPFFKALGHIKTVPQKAITMSPGLKDLCFSITGGSLAAQGYWMPYDTAKALAATFCWKIRFALTPLFGDDFPDLCTAPEDPAYKRFSIDPAIVQKCKEEASSWRLGSQVSRSPDSETQPNTDLDAQDKEREPIQIRLRCQPGKSYGDDDSSDVYNDSHGEDSYSRSIQPARRAAMHQAHSSNHLTSAATSPSPWFSSVQSSPASRTDSSTAKRCLEDTDNDADESSVACSESNTVTAKRWKIGDFGPEEVMAAHALLQLRRGAW